MKKLGAIINSSFYTLIFIITTFNLISHSVKFVDIFTLIQEQGLCEDAKTLSVTQISQEEDIRTCLYAYDFLFLSCRSTVTSYNLKNETIIAIFPRGDPMPFTTKKVCKSRNGIYYPNECAYMCGYFRDVAIYNALYTVAFFALMTFSCICFFLWCVLSLRHLRFSFKGRGRGKSGQGGGGRVVKERTYEEGV